MTDALPTPCRDPTCPETSTGPYCDEHGAERASRKSELDERPSARERGYDGDWEAVAARYKKKNPLCERHKLFGETVTADLVHHIIPLPKGGPRLDPDNLQSLCYQCHAEAHSDDAV